MKKELKKFGLMSAFGTGLLGTVLYLRGMDLALYLLGISFVFLLLGIVAPSALYPFHRMSRLLGKFLFQILTYVTLTTVYYLILTPIGLIAKLTGKQFLEKWFKTEEKSFWISRKMIPWDKGRYELPF